MTAPLGTGTSTAAPSTTAPSTSHGTVRPTTGTTLGPTAGTGGSPVTTITSPADSSTTSPATSPSEMATTTTVPTVQTFAGYLAYPDDVSATYQVGGETVSATATWTGTPTLSLTITCTSQHVSRNGESGISLAVTDDHRAGVPCNVTLAESPSEEGTVSYSLSVSLASS